MPKTTLRLSGSSEEASQSSLSLYPICVLTLTGIETHLSLRTMPDEFDLLFNLASIEVKDPRAGHSVRSVNKELPASFTP